MPWPRWGARRWTSDRRIGHLLILPLFHVNGIVVSMLMPLLAGASVVIAEQVRSTHLLRHRRAPPTRRFFSAVPTIYTMLTALPDGVRPGHRRRCGSASVGPPPPPRNCCAASRARYGFPLIEGYGLSESNVCSTINPVAGERRAEHGGHRVPWSADPHRRRRRHRRADEVRWRGRSSPAPTSCAAILGRPEETARASSSTAGC